MEEGPNQVIHMEIEPVNTPPHQKKEKKENSIPDVTCQRDQK